jgi:hypothetical protein
MCEQGYCGLAVIGTSSAAGQLVIQSAVHLLTLTLNQPRRNAEEEKHGKSGEQHKLFQPVHIGRHCSHRSLLSAQCNQDTRTGDGG